MGKLKERLATTITADLVQWHRIGNEFVGTIFNSIDDSRWPDLTRVRMTFVEVQHWPALSQHWNSHFIGKTEQGLYFKMNIEHQIRLGVRHD